MRTICCRCGCVVVDEPPAPGGLVSHGLCRRCAIIELKQMARGWTLAMMNDEIERIEQEKSHAFEALRAAPSVGLIEELNQCERELTVLRSERGRRKQ